MANLTRINAKQRARIPEYQAKWQALERSTDRCDLGRCQEALAKIYKTLDLTLPKVVMVQSPREMALTAIVLSGSEPTWSRKITRNLTWKIQRFVQTGVVSNPRGRDVGPNLDRELQNSLEPRSRNNVWSSVQAQLTHDFETRSNEVRKSSLDITKRFTGCKIQPALEDLLVHGMMDLAIFRDDPMLGARGSMAAFDFYLHVLDLERYRNAEGLIEMGEQSGWWLIDRDFVMISQRPTLLCKDNLNRLHNDKGPAVQYADGFSVYAHHGVRVPKDIIEDPAAITLERIQEERNSEIARVMLLQFGEERFLNQFTPIGDPWRGSQLYEAVLGDRTLARIRCLNSTPEPDGTTKVYWLKVERGMSCAQQALASIHFNPLRTDWGQYNPVMET